MLNLDRAHVNSCSLKEPSRFISNASYACSNVKSLKNRPVQSYSSISRVAFYEILSDLSIMRTNFSTS